MLGERIRLPRPAVPGSHSWTAVSAAATAVAEERAAEGIAAGGPSRHVEGQGDVVEEIEPPAGWNMSADAFDPQDLLVLFRKGWFRKSSRSEVCK